MSVTTPIQEKTHAYCKHCETEYLATTENFYTKKGKLARDICKSCKREKAKIYEKNRPPRVYKDTRVGINKRDRREYTKAYNLKKKLEKEALKNKEN